MSKITIVGGNIIERIGGKDLSFARGEIINIGSSVIQTGKEKGVSYGIPRFTPLIQQIKLIVNFRPKKDWKGEFGFDWMRQDDTKLFNDNKFIDIVAYQYTDSKYTTKVKSHNQYDGYFKTDKTMYDNLKKLYKPFSIPWKTIKDTRTGKEKHAEYYPPWLSIKKDKEVEITFFAEIEEEADYLEFSKSDYFTFTPNTIEIKGQKKIPLDKYKITIKCVKEFSSDQTIDLKAFKEEKGTKIESLVGKINVWANDKSKQKKKDVVFVEIRTLAISSKKEKKIIIDDEKARINQYLGQAYIQLSDTSDIVELDLSNDKNFLSFVTNGEIDPNKKSGGKELEDYLKSKLEAAYPKKYAQHFKAFYFAEHGYHPNGGNLSGYSSHGADYVVVFKSRNNQTAAHEFLHSMNLAHTFTNKEA
ncbi:hypothetical protein HMPREF9700_00003, partial [Bergeyella zoohelcum CCUG 30536]|uniref:hypothetical protein n=1 Tax=Bergeyella zoohelcum TaxID=1015 RepID=UPI000280C389